MNWIDRAIAEVREHRLPTLDLATQRYSGTDHDESDRLTSFPPEILELTWLEELDLSNHRISFLPPKLARLKDLRHVDLCGNAGIEHLKILGELERLQVLGLDNTDLRILPEEVARLPSLRSLDLFGNMSVQFPPTLFKSTSLKRLAIGYTQVSLEALRKGCLPNLNELLISGSIFDQHTAEISHLKHIGTLALYSYDYVGGDLIDEFDNLHELRFIRGSFERFPRELASLKSLTGLRFYHCSGMGRIPDTVTEFMRLNTLGVESNDSEPVDVSRRIFDLPSLKHLFLSNCALDTIPRFKSPHRMRALSLRDCELEEVPPALFKMRALEILDLSGNDLKTLPQELFQLRRLKSLRLDRAMLAEIPQGLSNLHSLNTLSLSGNPLAQIPDEVFELTELEELTLSETQLNRLPGDVSRLTNLRNLNLNENVLKELPEAITELSRLRELHVENNPLSSPPPEIVRRGIAAIQTYFAELEDSKNQRLFEAKLLLVGEGEVGKTCLANKLVDPGFDIRKESERVETTRGIEITRWVTACGREEDIKVHVWDFGGQEIYHSTHQFFLTRRSLYVFVWDARKEDRLGGFDYWLNVVKLQSDSSPLLIVLNKADERVRELDQVALKAQFPNVVEFFTVSALTGTGMDGLRSKIRELIAKLPHIGDRWPSRWSRIRSELERDSRDYIDHEEYLKICERYELDRASAEVLSVYLHDLGVILHFTQDPLLSQIVILKPEWGTNAVYQVLDTREIQDSLGRFTFKQLETIWDRTKYPAHKHAELLQLMIRFELCFPLAGTTTYIAPELLRAERPMFTWDTRDSLRFEYHYEFMPAGILTRFIARKHDFIDGEQYWRNGVVLTWDGATALVVSEPMQRKIRVAVIGTEAKSMLAMIRHELDHIHRTLNNPAVKEMIPCVCPRCTANEPFFFEYRVLKRYIEGGIHEAVCNESIKRVRIDRLLGGVFECKLHAMPRSGRGDEMVNGYEMETHTVPAQRPMKRNMQALRRLQEFLGETYDRDEFLRLVSSTFGTEFLQGVSGGSTREMMHQAILAAERHRLLDGEFFRTLLNERPRSASVIREIAMAFRVDMPTPSDEEAT